MKKKDFIFQFHNPNTEETTTIFFLQTVLKANAKYIEKTVSHHVSSKEHRPPSIYNK